jgi:glucose-1-phosphate adenylyltransferase
MPLSAKVITIILGGGRGTRLFPLTKKRAKPAVPIGGKYRLIDISLSNSINSGYRFIYLLTQYASDSLIRHIQETYQFGPFVRGHVQILTAQQTLDRSEWYQGTADAVRQHMERFKAKRPDHYLILSGDHLYRMDYRKLVAFHREGGWDLTIAFTPVSQARAGEFGIVKVDPHCRITAFCEKPKTAHDVEALTMDPEIRDRFDFRDAEKSLAGSMGVYLCNPLVLEAYTESQLGMVDFGKDILPHAIHACKVGGYLFDGSWEDIGTIRSYYEASLALTGPAAFNFYDPTFPIYTHRRYLSATRIERARVVSSLISDGAEIEAGSRIERSIVGIRSIIGPDADIAGSVLMGNDYYEEEESRREPLPLGIGAGSKLRGVIVDKNVRIGPGCVLTNEAGRTEYDCELCSIRDGIIVIPKDTTVPPGTKI